VQIPGACFYANADGSASVFVLAELVMMIALTPSDADAVKLLAQAAVHHLTAP
jgi:hypothetical protein